MEEKILVISERHKVEFGLCIFFIIIAIIGGIFAYFFYLDELGNSVFVFSDCSCADQYVCTIHTLYSSPEAYALHHSKEEMQNIFGYVAGIGIICLLIYAWMRSYEIIVTDKRVYGQAAFGKRVDLPIDSVSAIGSTWPKGIAVATSSGKIAFLMIKNRDEIHMCVSDLLIERQNKLAAVSVHPPVIKQEVPASNADELKKYKELLDMGVLSQDEFDAKKKQLLGL